jgi:putative ABC transport system substrate-binding protein
MQYRMKRRQFIALLGTIAGSIAADAQEPGRIYRIGFLIPSPRDTAAALALFDELRLQGFIEGQNLLVIPGGFDVPNGAVAERAAVLVKAAPDVIIAGPEIPVRTLQAATRTLPIVAMTEDMVAAGLVPSLARPGGNTTGISLLSPELDGKREDILIAAVPSARRIAALSDSNVTPPHHLEMLQRAARSRGVELSVFGVGKPEEITSAIDAAKSAGAEALNFLATPLFSVPGSRNNEMVLERISAVRLPAIFQWPDTAEAGALLAYATPKKSRQPAARSRIKGCKPETTAGYRIADSKIRLWPLRTRNRAAGLGCRAKKVFSAVASLAKNPEAR